MTQVEFEQEVHERSVQAGMNQRIHQHLAAEWVRKDRKTKIAVAGLAVASLCLTVTGLYSSSIYVMGVALLVSICGAVAAITLNVLPFGEWATEHIALYQRWTDVREDIDSVCFDLKGAPTPAHLKRLKEIAGRIHRICGSEKRIDPELILKCYTEEEASRHPKTNEPSSSASVTPCAPSEPTDASAAPLATT